MPFGVGQVVTNVGKAIQAKRMTGGGSPSQAEPKFAGHGTGATGAARTAAVGDTALTTEVDTRSGANAGTTVTTSVTNDTYQVVNTVTAAAPRSVDEAGLFDASSSGNMYTSATFNVVSLGTGDAIQYTWQVQFT